MSIKAILKWTLLAFTGIFIVSVVYVMATRDATNVRVAQQIRDNPEGQLAQKTMLLTLEDQRMYPVNFLREGKHVYMGIDGLWWREFVDAPQLVTMFIRGEQYIGSARTILDDPERKAEVFSRLRPKVPGWLPDILDGKLVVISVEE